MDRVNPICLLVVLLLPCAAWSAGAVAALPASTWRLLSESPPDPPSLRLPMGVYDPVRHRVLVVDTQDVGGPLGVWAFTPAPTPAWTPLSAMGEAPGRLYLASLVYDPPRDRLLVFGSALGSDFQVWALSLAGTPSWQHLSADKTPPAARWGHSAVYDPVGDRVILFGGTKYGTPTETFSAETWGYSLTTGDWSVVADAPPALLGREGHGAMYDPVNERMLVFGGHREDATRGFLDDVWELRLRSTPVWSEIPVAGPRPGARSAFGTVYDPVRRRMLVHGGINVESGIEPDDLWALSLDGPPSWSKITPLDTLRGRSYPVDVYDPDADAFLACGGGGYPQVSKLPLAAPERWQSVLPPLPRTLPGLRSHHSVVYDTRRDRFLSIGGEFASTDSSIWAFSAEGSPTWQPIAAPLSVFFDFFASFFSGECSRMVYDAAGDRVVFFDGHQVLTARADRLTEWVEFGPPRPDAIPGVSQGASLTIDTRRNRLLVTGGWNYAPHSSDYTATGVLALPLAGEPTWSVLGTLPLPWGSAGHASYYDAANDRLVLLGGYRRNGGLLRDPIGGQVWSTPLDSAIVWRRHGSPADASVPAPPYAFAAYDPVRQELCSLGDSVGWVRGIDDTAGWRQMTFANAGPRITHSLQFDPVRSQVVALFGSEGGYAGARTWAFAVGPLTVALLDSRRTPDAIELSWRSTTAVGKPATLERREAPGDWMPLAALDFDVRGLANFSDESVLPGHDYAYRVRVADGDSSYVSAATLVAPPSALQLAMLGARPNPAIGRFQLAFSLPDAAAARLELFDLRGRRCASREVGALGAGRHTIAIGESNALVPGVYFARLRRGGASQVQRVVLTR